MKMKKLKKLSLRREVVANLEQTEMSQLKGGFPTNPTLRDSTLLNELI